MLAYNSLYYHLILATWDSMVLWAFLLECVFNILFDLPQKIIWIRCTPRFNAGSRIIDNKLKGYYFLFLTQAGVLNLWVPILAFANPAGQSLPLLNLTWPKLGINFIIFNSPYKQNFSIGFTWSPSSNQIREKASECKLLVKRLFIRKYYNKILFTFFFFPDICVYIYNFIFHLVSVF